MKDINFNMQLGYMDSGLNIQVGKMDDWHDYLPFYFLNPSYTKYKRMPEFARGTEGVPISVAQNHHYQITICCKRVSSTAVRIAHFSWKSFSWIKAVTVSVPDVNINFKAVLRLSGNKGSDVLFYHESSPIMEVRKTCTLKKIAAFNIETICRSVNMMQYYAELKNVLEPVYVARLSKLLLCLGSIIVLSDRQESTDIIYRCEKQSKRESFINLYYNSELNKAFAGSSTRIVLLEFDDTGVCGSRILLNPLMKNNLNIISWAPLESIIIYSSRTPQNKDDIYFVDCSGTQPRVICTMKNKLPGQEYYSEEINALLYIDEDFSNKKQARCVWISNIKEEYGASENDSLGQDETDEAIIEGEYLASVPERYQKMDRMIMMYYKKTLFCQPLPHDLPFKL